MRIWALSDPHLGLGTGKKMDIFGKHWGDHSAQIAAAWRACVAESDAVLLSGDISWAINYEELEADFRFLDALPGLKIIGRGNHDYWWASVQKNQRFCAERGFKNFDFLRSNALRLIGTEERSASANDASLSDVDVTAAADASAGASVAAASVEADFAAAPAFELCPAEVIPAPGLVLCGTRGWITPGHPDWKNADEKYYLREAIRLRLALEEAGKVRTGTDRLLVALHYPPFGPDGTASLFTQLLEEFAADICIFGHVHGEKGRRIARREEGGILYLNTACDVLDFAPLLLCELN